MEWYRLRRLSSLLLVMDYLLTRFSLWYYVPPPSDSYLTSIDDLWLLYVLRVTLLFYSIFFDGSRTRCEHVCTMCFTMSSIAYAIGKYVAFCEEQGTLWVVGACLATGWAGLASAALYWVVRKDLENNRERLKADEQPDQIINDHPEDIIKEITKLNFYEQILFTIELYYEYKIRFFLSSVFFVLKSFASAVSPLYSSEAVQSVVQMRDHDVILYNIKAAVCIEMLVRVSDTIYSYLVDTPSRLIGSRIERSMYSYLLQQEISYFDKLTDQSATMQMYNVTHIGQFYYMIRDLIQQVVGGFSSLIFMASISPKLSLLSFIEFPLSFAIDFLYEDRRDYDEEDKIFFSRTHLTDEAFEEMRTVRAFGYETELIEGFSELQKQKQKRDEKAASENMITEWMSLGVEKVIEAVIMAYAGYLAFSGAIPGETFMTFVLYQKAFASNVLSVRSSLQTLRHSYERTRDALSVAKHIANLPSTSKGNCTDPITGRVEVSGVSFSYPSRPNDSVLKDVSFTIEPGQFVALVGPSGSGKSSIVALLEGFYEPTEGEILVDGKRIAEYDRNHFHRAVSLVGQEPKLFWFSIKKNICIGYKEATDEQVEEATKLVNAYDFIKDMKEGFDTSCGYRGEQLSGGQKQRIAIARAIIRHPSLLILDEATSALDSATEKVVQEALDRCSEGRSSLVIAHRLSTIAKADKILVLKDGRIIQSGSHVELMRDTEGLYYSMVEQQTAGLIIKESDEHNASDQNENLEEMHNEDKENVEEKNYACEIGFEKTLERLAMNAPNAGA